MTAEGPKTLFLTAITDFQTAAIGDLEGVGTIRQEGANFYRYVKNASGSTLLAGMPVCYDLLAATASGGAKFHEEVIIPTSATLNTFAGIAMAATTTLGFGWIQIEGYYASVIISLGKTSIAAGINAFPADTVSYVVGNSLAAQSLTVDSISNQMVGRINLAVTIASSSASGAGATANSTAVGCHIHCLTV